MGLLQWLGFKPTPSPTPIAYWQQPVDWILADNILNKPIEALWREQPHLRTVVGFIARNCAHIGLHVYERGADDSRERIRTGPLAETLETPNPQDTLYELIYATVSSLCLYDTAHWFVAPDENSPSRWVIRHIPVQWIVGTYGSGAFEVAGYKVSFPNTAGHFVDIPAENIIDFHGYAPGDPKMGTSPIHALRAILSEQIHAQTYRDQVWRRGGRTGSYLTRPAGTPWPDDVRTRFLQEWQSQYAGDDAPKAGGVPLLEDGMEIKKLSFSAKEDQYIEGARLSLETCAQVFHVSPVMVGILDDANYANVREFRKMLYGDTLGPLLEFLQQRLNASLVPLMANKRTTYVEFNLQSKLAGSFEEQGAIMQQAIGGPYMLINEGRARLNMPAIEGGDKLIVPLNITHAGDQNPIPAAPPPADDDPSGDEDGDAVAKATYDLLIKRIDGHAVNGIPVRI